MSAGDRNTIVTDNARRIFKEKGLTQHELAAELDISQESVSRYLRNGAKWSIDMVFAWAVALGVAVESLIHADAASKN